MAAAFTASPVNYNPERPTKRGQVGPTTIERCPNCGLPVLWQTGGALKIIAAPSTRLRTDIEDPPVIVKILTHLGLPTRAPPRSPAQRFDLFQTI
jgi:hypothetical protein